VGEVSGGICGGGGSGNNGGSNGTTTTSSSCSIKTLMPRLHCEFVVIHDTLFILVTANVWGSVVDNDTMSTQTESRDREVIVK